MYHSLCIVLRLLSIENMSHFHTFSPDFHPKLTPHFPFFFSPRLFPQVVGSFPGPAIPGSSPTDAALVAGAGDTGDTAPPRRSSAARPTKRAPSDDPPRAAARWFRWWRGSSSRLHHPERNGLIYWLNMPGISSDWRKKKDLFLKNKVFGKRIGTIRASSFM